MSGRVAKNCRADRRDLGEEREAIPRYSTLKTSRAAYWYVILRDHDTRGARFPKHEPGRRASREMHSANLSPLRRLSSFLAAVRVGGRRHDCISEINCWPGHRIHFQPGEKHFSATCAAKRNHALIISSFFTKFFAFLGDSPGSLFLLH